MTTQTLIITFETTTQAMRMEKYCMEHHIEGRLIPLPTQISAGCGLAWKTRPDALDMVIQQMKDGGLSWQQIAIIEL